MFSQREIDRAIRQGLKESLLEQLEKATFGSTEFVRVVCLLKENGFKVPSGVTSIKIDKR